MNIIAIIANFNFQDLFDILFLTVVAYHLFIWFQGTKAFKALIGLLVLGAVFTIAKAGGVVSDHLGVSISVADSGYPVSGSFSIGNPTGA